ncbi:MAG TPA: M23 family metallopeptidase, partial [Acidobacteriota bacterium]|nr:M23 family metallopeptidase [Acidobacteriota bacterium]
LRLTLISADEGRSSSVYLSMRGLVVLVALLVSLITLLVFSGLSYHRMWAQSQQYEELVREVDLLRRNSETFRLAAKQLEDRISGLQVTAQKLRIGSGFDLDALGGVGGPSSSTDPVLSLNQRDLLQHFKTLEKKRLTLETELRQLQDYYTTREILLAATPSILPVRGYPSDRFGSRSDPFDGETDFHPGIDISAPRGAKVVATADGIVAFAGRRSGYGKMVALEHKFGMSTRYGHLDRYTVESGQKVKKGDIVGYVGTTGRTTGPHLHYEVRLNSQPLNPLRFFRDSLN